MFAKLWRWAKRRHPKKSGHWIAAKYWRLETGHWDFATKEGVKLYQHTRKAIQRHIKVKGTASPYDGNTIYWAKRLRDNPILSSTLARLLQRDQGKCRWCERTFKDGDLIEIDHITPKAKAEGKNSVTNSPYTDIAMTSGTQKRPPRGTHDKSLFIEEPDAGKFASPFWRRAGAGDCSCLASDSCHS